MYRDVYGTTPEAQWLSFRQRLVAKRIYILLSYYILYNIHYMIYIYIYYIIYVIYFIILYIVYIYIYILLYIVYIYILYYI